MSKPFLPIIRGYRLIDQPIGSGPTGAVYQARALVGRSVRAIKLLKPWGAGAAFDDKFRRRFYRSLLDACRSPHTHILHVEDAAAARGRFYVLADYCPDRSLRALLRRRNANRIAWPLTQTIELFRQAAAGLAHAHARNLLHGNIKPSNLLLQRVEDNLSGYYVKLSDFGGNPLDSPDALHSALALPADTWTYAMAPERFRPNQEDDITLTEPTPEGDIYGLGILLYEALVRELPDTEKPTNLSEAYRWHCQTNWPQPHNERPDLPDELDRFISACLSRDPADRPTALEAMAGLEAALDNLQAEGARRLGHLSAIAESILPPTREPSNKQTSAVATPASPSAVEPPAEQSNEELYLPQLQVIDYFSRTMALGGTESIARANSTALKLYTISGDGLIIGQKPEHVNDQLGVELHDDQLAARQLSVDWDGFRVVVTNHEDNGAVFLNGVPLPADETKTWDWDATLRAGSYYLQLLRPMRLLDSLILAPPSGEEQAERLRRRIAAAAPPDSHIALTPIPDADLLIVPGQPASFSVGIKYNIRASDAPLVERIELRVEGGLARWIANPIRTVPINPDDYILASFEVNVPRTSECRAAAYPTTIRAESQIKDAGNRRLIPSHQMTWHVAPFADSKLDIRPKRQRAQQNAQFNVLLHNTGNEACVFALSSEDDEQSLDIMFSDPTINVLPGQRRTVAVNVTRPRHWFGRPQTRTFTVTSTPQPAGEQKAVAATFEQPPLIPMWVALLFALLLLLLGCTSYLWRMWPAAAFERVIGNQALYGIMRPTLTPQPTVLITPMVRLPVIQIIAPATPTLTPTLEPSATSTLIPTAAPTPTATPTPLPWTPTPAPSSTPPPPPDPYPACPPRFVPSIIEGQGGNPGDIFVVYFDNRPVGGGNQQTDVVGPDRTYRALVSIGDEQDGFHTISIRHSDSVIAEFQCWLGPRPAQAPNIVITVPPAKK